jgi:hypothetical protein
MNPLEALIVILLTLFDLIMDMLTLGWWSVYRGEEIVVLKTRK